MTTATDQLTEAPACVICGSTGGATKPGRIVPIRIKRRCQRCYSAKQEKVNPNYKPKVYKTDAELRLDADQQKLVEDNRWLAINYAMKRASGKPYYDDFLSEAFIGLIRAAKDYDPTTYAFSTYAYRWMIHRTMRFVCELVPIVKVPAYLRYDSKVITKSRANYVDRGKAVAAAAAKCSPFNEMFDSPTHLGSDPKEIAETADDIRWLRAQLGTLSERDQQVMSMRMAGNTLKVIGEAVGVTRERVRQIERETIARFRESARVGGAA